VQRRARVRGAVFSISLVGYTNSGKSTLFNALTHAGALEADRLFATLDTTTRRIHVPEAGTVALSDTVGFIRELPHTLVESFRATLEETVHADLLLHVVDSASPVRERQIEDVNAVLREIAADSIPQIEVWNKIDLRDGGTAPEPGAVRDEYGRISRVFVSARTGAGLAELRMAIVEAAQRRATAAPAAVAISL
jgi:GTP-binding protein HflX